MGQLRWMMAAVIVAMVVGSAHGQSPKDASSDNTITQKGPTLAAPLLRSRSHVEHVDNASFKKGVLDAQVPVLVDFYADWCVPCKKLAPLLEEIASDNPNAKVVKVNVDESPELAARYQISSIPSLKVFKSGKLVAQHVGLADKRRLESMLSR
jgi:thioredoxin 1